MIVALSLLLWDVLVIIPDLEFGVDRFLGWFLQLASARLAVFGRRSLASVYGQSDFNPKDPISSPSPNPVLLRPALMLGEI